MAEVPPGLIQPQHQLVADAITVMKLIKKKFLTVISVLAYGITVKRVATLSKSWCTPGTGLVIQKPIMHAVTCLDLLTLNY